MAIGPVLPETPLVLDSDVLRDWRYQKQSVKREIDKYIGIHKRPPALTSMTMFEALHGLELEAIHPSSNKELLERDRNETQRLIQYCRALPSGSSPSGILPFDPEAAAIAAYIAAHLTGRKIRKDIFIAATALAHGHGVATRNEDDFRLIANNIPSQQLLRLVFWKP